jgi:hypothetical protein
MTYKNKGFRGEVISEYQYLLLPLTERLYYKQSYDAVTHSAVVNKGRVTLTPLEEDKNDLKWVSISSSPSNK